MFQYVRDVLNLLQCTYRNDSAFADQYMLKTTSQKQHQATAIEHANSQAINERNPSIAETDNTAMDRNSGTQTGRGFPNGRMKHTFGFHDSESAHYERYKSICGYSVAGGNETHYAMESYHISVHAEASLHLAHIIRQPSGRFIFSFMANKPEGKRRPGGGG